MKILESKIFDCINSSLSLCQSKLDILRQSSFLLSKIDIFIFLAIILVYIVSIFSSNNVTAVFAGIIPILVVIKVLMTKGEKIELESCNFYLIIYLLICIISCFTSSLKLESFYGLSKTLLYIAFYFALCQFLRTNKKYIILILITISGLVTFESIIGLLQNAAGAANISTWQDTSYVNPEDVLTRVYGTLKPYNPNLFGGWLVVGIPSLIGISIICCYKKYIIPAIISITAALTSILCLFFTGCRGAYVALFAIILSLLIVLFKTNKIGKIIAMGTFLSGSLFIFLHHGILKRLMSIFIMRADSSTSFRMNVYNSAIEMFKDNPIFGIGAGNKVFREIYGLYMLSGFDALSCYSVFLEIAVESGIFALIAFLMFLCSLLKGGITNLQIDCQGTKNVVVPRNDEPIYNKIIIFTAVISIIGVMVHGLVDTVFFRPQIQFIFWTMAAIITSYSKKAYYVEKSSC